MFFCLGLKFLPYTNVLKYVVCSSCFSHDQSPVNYSQLIAHDAENAIQPGSTSHRHMVNKIPYEALIGSDRGHGASADKINISCNIYIYIVDGRNPAPVEVGS